jgi:esterase/lipase superfamily enzyme
MSLAPFLWQGTRVPVAPAAVGAAAAPGTSFIISNRYPTWIQNDTYPLPNGEMNWFMSTVQANDPVVDNYVQQGSSSATVPDSFKQAIYNALLSQATPQLTVFIHGLGNLFSDAIWSTSWLGTNLASFANYQGLVIGFDWPSYDEYVSGLYYASNGSPYYFPPVATSGTIRDNINGSRPAFANLISFLTSLRESVNGLTVSVVCHSEGNYMAELGLLYNATQYFDHMLMLAADINDAVLQQPFSGDTLIGQGNGIVHSATDVTVYFTGNDDVLPLSLYAWEYDYHNPEFGSRLGSAGPSYNAGPQSSNVYSVDCSGVINVKNFRYLQSQGIIPKNSDNGALSMHTSYLFIPQVLQDMKALITGSSPGGIPNRETTANAGGYFMQLNNNNNQKATESLAAVAAGGML